MNNYYYSVITIKRNNDLRTAYLKSLITRKRLHSLRPISLFKYYSNNRKEYSYFLYSIKYKKNFILNKKSLLLHGHKERVLFFLLLKDKRYLTASKNEIIIWDNKKNKVEHRVKIPNEIQITKVIQLSNEKIVIGSLNALYLYIIGESDSKVIAKFTEGIVYDIKEIQNNTLCVLFFKAVYIINTVNNTKEKINIEEIYPEKSYLFVQIVQINKDKILVFDYHELSSFIYNINTKELMKFPATEVLYESYNYLKSFHLISENHFLIDSEMYITFFTKNTQSYHIINNDKIKFFLKKRNIDILYNQDENVEFKMININNEYYIKKIKSGYAIIEATTAQPCTVIAGPIKNKTFFFPMETYTQGVYLYFADNGNVYILE